ncbi:MAG: hypothetical protein HXS47_13810 [Theionarchaea archaeon]|nr:hypothetical protein [Theionarchaea archaeon]
MKRFIPIPVILLMILCALPLHGSDASLLTEFDLAHMFPHASENDIWECAVLSPVNPQSSDPLFPYSDESSTLGDCNIDSIILHGQIITGSSSVSTLQIVLLTLILGMLSGLSPTLLKIHANIITEVAHTTRQETDVIIRSLLFNGGLFFVLTCLFLLLTLIPAFSFIVVLLGIVVGINLLNSALHAFNSYTRIDIILKTKFISYAPGSAVQLGFLHGIGKFSDSAPFFLVVVYLAITGGPIAPSLLLLLFYLLGILLTYGILLLYALFKVNVFRKFLGSGAKKGYFFPSALLVFTISSLLMWNIRSAVNTSLAISLTALVLILSGVIIGFKKRIIY